MNKGHKISEWESKQPYNVWFGEISLSKGYVTRVWGGIKGNDAECLVWNSAGECSDHSGERLPRFDVRW